MPEGHSIHRSAIQFAHNFVGRRIEVSSPQGKFSADAELINGRAMTSARAHGKQLLLEFDNNLFLQVHLGIYGAWQFYGDISCAPAISAGSEGIQNIGAPRRPREASVTGSTSHSAENSLNAFWASLTSQQKTQIRARLTSRNKGAILSGPAVCRVLTQPEREKLLSKLGPDPFVNPSGIGQFITSANKSSLPIGKLLMDQTAIAGIGNIYRAEILFRLKINPFNPARTLTKYRLRKIWDDWSALLKCGIQTGQMITIDLAHKTPGHWVYNRHNLPCYICKNKIKSLDMAARKLYWCSVCQKS